MPLFALSPFVTARNKLSWSLAVGTWAIVVYGAAGEIAVHSDPVQLTMAAWERGVPFLPWTFWVYFSVNFIYLASCWAQKNLQDFSRFLAGYAVAYSVSALWFVALPTTFPRELYPLPLHTDSITTWAFHWFRGVDNPTNCFPSMHVASCVMSTMPFYRRRKKTFALFLLWSLMISATTLTTKQHYMLDVAGGALFGFIAHVLSFHYWPLRGSGGDEKEKRPIMQG